MHVQTGSDQERGFTLIEVMIAILITVIAVIGIISLHMTETRAASYSRHSTEATTLATDMLEKLRTTATPITGAEPAIDALGVAVTDGIFERAWTVTPVGTDYQDITVRVGWDEDEAAGVACAAHSTCDSKFCRGNNRCAGRAVVIVGRRNQ